MSPPKGRSRSEVAKVFWSGRSQAIRLPKEFRVSCREVRIHREGDRIVLEPAPETLDARGWPVGFWKLFGRLDASFDLGDRRRPAERADPLK